MFSLYLGYTNEVSKMIIGGYDESRIEQRGTKLSASDDINDMSKSADGIFWMYINSHFYWMVDLYEAKING